MSARAASAGRDSRLRLWGSLLLLPGLLLAALAIVLIASPSSLAFLSHATGWQLGFSVLPQSPGDPYLWTLGIAVANTLMLAAISILAATVVGFVLALVMVSGQPLWSRVARAYVLVFRNVPLVLQAFFWFAVLSHMPGPRQALRFAGVVVSNRGVAVPMFTEAGFIACAVWLIVAVAVWKTSRHPRARLHPFARLVASVLAAFVAATVVAFAFPGEGPLVSVPELAGFNFQGGVQLPTELVAVFVAMALFGSSYVAEIVRGGFATVPRGVIEAARALGMPPFALEFKVRLPLAMRAILLPLGSQFTTLIKATSIGLAVGFTDLFAVTLMSINQSGYTITLLILMSACFVVLNHLVIAGFSALNRAYAIPGFGSR